MDGRWFNDKGEVQVDAGDSHVLSSSFAEWSDNTIVRRGFRAEKYVATFKFNP